MIGGFVNGGAGLICIKQKENNGREQVTKQCRPVANGIGQKNGYFFVAKVFILLDPPFFE